MKGYHNYVGNAIEEVLVVNTSPMKGYHNTLGVFSVMYIVVNTSPMKGYHNIEIQCVN